MVNLTIESVKLFPSCSNYAIPTNPDYFTIKDDCLLLCYTLHCAFNWQKLDAST